MHKGQFRYVDRFGAGLVVQGALLCVINATVHHFSSILGEAPGVIILVVDGSRRMLQH